MLRITPSGYRRVRTIHLDGKLVGPWVEELRRAIGRHDERESVCLNLAHLTFADSAGLCLLQELHRSGAQLVGVLPLIDGLLALDAGDGCAMSHAPLHR
jgi:ABC-type transporter Mla MlaB component